LPSRRRRSSFLLVWLATALIAWAAGPGFRSRSQFLAHYKKHGSEFGAISQQEYLRLAQALRDAPAGGDILEAVRPDGEFSKFDRKRGYFGAFNKDGTIRTFFVPGDGERYFRRQAKQSR
jgi:pyocin large subunit-like protein